MTKKKTAAERLAASGRPVFPLNGKLPYKGCTKCSEKVWDDQAQQMVPNPQYTCGGGATCPCVEKGNPQGNLCHGCYAATTDADVIRAWWDRYPDANIGHHLIDWRYVVVDVDPQNDGSAAFKFLEEKYGTLDSVQTVRTPQGGAHYYLDNPSGIPVRRGANVVGRYLLGRDKETVTGIDIKSGPGHYVLAPGSEVNGNEYVTV